MLVAAAVSRFANKELTKQEIKTWKKYHPAIKQMVNDDSAPVFETIYLRVSKIVQVMVYCTHANCQMPPEPNNGLQNDSLLMLKSISSNM